jgi:hypothetical protein
MTGDTTVLRLSLERVLPPRRERPVEFPLPSKIETVAEAISASSLVLADVRLLSCRHATRQRRVLPPDLTRKSLSFNKTLKLQSPRRTYRRFAARDALPGGAR